MSFKLPPISAVQNHRILVRVDFNVPLLTDPKSGVVTVDDATRILAARATIEWLKKHGAKIILISHLGRPKCLELDRFGKSSSDNQFSLQPVANYMAEKLKLPVKFVPDCIGETAEAAITEMKPGEILLLENLRFYPAEKNNEAWFAKALAELGDIYINEAFSNCHREHASMSGVPRILPTYGGLGLQAEVTHLNQIIEKPHRPLIIVVGGAKIADKIGALKNLSRLADAVLVGGGIANDFLKSQNIEVHQSAIEDESQSSDQAKINYVTVAGEIISQYKNERVLKDGYIPLPKIIYPVDAIAAKSIESNQTQIIDLTHNVADTDDDKPLTYLDIGPKTTKLYCELIKTAGTIFWNGPMGVFEKPQFSAGTEAVAKAITKSAAVTVAGGGNTIAAIEHFKLTGRFDFVSAAGSAALEFLSGTILPGLAAIERSNKAN